MERSIAEVARITGTTSRTLRHYGDVGLLAPSRVGANGYRYYDEDALVRLQRILLLRQLGLGIPAISEVLRGHADDVGALHTHLELLAREKERLSRQIASVELTLKKMNEREQLVAEDMFDGFDPSQYKDEVIGRWGQESYAKSDAWWRAKSKADQRAYVDQHAGIAAEYQAARDAGEPAAGSRVQSIVARHVDWLNLAAEFTGG